MRAGFSERLKGSLNGSFVPGRGIDMGRLIIVVLLSTATAAAQSQAAGQQTPNLKKTAYVLRAGEAVRIEASPETRDFFLSAKERRVAVEGPRSTGLVVGPSVSGKEILLGASLLTKAGDYNIKVTAIGERGEEREAVLSVTVAALRPVAAATSQPPVLLLNGWEISQTSSCPITTAAETFGSLPQFMQDAGVPNVYFFDNCVECPNCLIENIGNVLAQAVNSIADTTGAVVPQVDIVAHSMGGLIARSYLAGLQSNGTLAPPANPRIRKLVEIATPNFGSFFATNLLGAQTQEMIPGSPFLFNLATWNQRGDDLRGVDAIAIVGNAGHETLGSLSNSGDGVVSLTSASLGFATALSRTRVVPNCHINSANSLAGFLIDCSGSGIASVTSLTDPTTEVVLSFLQDTATWESIGTSTTLDAYLSKYGGVYFALQTVQGQWVNDLSSVQFSTVPLSPSSATSTVWFNEFVSGTDTFTEVSRSLGTSTCGPLVLSIGYYSVQRCKFGPVISSVGPLATNVSGKIVSSGTSISISGTGFGLLPCTTCQVVANPGATILQIASWSNTLITATLPAFSGLVELVIVTSSGQDSINIMTTPLQVAAPVLSATLTNASAFIQGELGVYTRS